MLSRNYICFYCVFTFIFNDISYSFLLFIANNVLFQFTDIISETICAAPVAIIFGSNTKRKINLPTKRFLHQECCKSEWEQV